jgi:hypothetical protein
VAQPRNRPRLHLAVLATIRPVLDPADHRVPRTKPTCLLHTWRPHRKRPFALVLHLHQQESSCNLHLQYLAKNQFTQCCQSLITPGNNHPLVLEPHMVLKAPPSSSPKTPRSKLQQRSYGNQRKGKRKEMNKKKLQQAIESQRKGKEQDHLKKTSLGPFRQGQRLDTSETNYAQAKSTNHQSIQQLPCTYASSP